jgi:hypothetical protein
MVEYGLRFPAASVARTRYEYEVDPVNPLSLNVVAVGVAICAKFAHPAPWHFSTLYPVTPTLSVDAVHDRLICAGEAAVAVKLAGAVGGVVSGCGGAVAPFPAPLHPPNSKALHAANKVRQSNSRKTRFATPLFI